MVTPPARDPAHPMITIWVLLGYVAIALGATWPAARKLGTAYIGFPGDTAFDAYVLEWGYRCLPHGLAGFWDAPFFFPLPKAIAYSEPMLGMQLLYAPARLLIENTILAYNLAYLAEFILTGYGAFLLARYLTAHAAASFVAGALFELFPYKPPLSSHPAVLSLGFVPLTLLAAHRTLDRGRVRDALLLGLSYAAAFLTGEYVGLFLGLLLALFLPIMTLASNRSARSAGLVAATMLASLAVLAIAHAPVLEAKREHALERGMQENVFWSARPTDYLAAYAPTLAGRIPVPNPTGVTAERLCYAGALPLLLSAIALLSFRSTPAIIRGYIVLAAIAVLLSLGPYLVLSNEKGTRLVPLPYLLLYRYVPGFSSLRVPARLCTLVAALLVPVAAHAAARLLDRLPRAAWVFAAFAPLVQWTEAWPRAYPTWTPPDFGADAAYRAIRGAPGSFAVAEVPADFKDGGVPMLGSLRHGRPVVNGFSGFDLYEGKLDRLSLFPSPPTIGFLQSLSKGDVRVRRVIWRRQSGYERPFGRARHLGHAYPAAPLIADYGDTLLFEIRPHEEFFRVSHSPAALGPPALLPLQRFTADVKHWRDDSGIALRFPGSINTRLPLRRGPLRIQARCLAWSDTPSLPPVRLSVALDGSIVGEAVLPWGREATIGTETIDVVASMPYELRIAVEPTGALGRRPSMWVKVMEVAMQRGP